MSKQRLLQQHFYILSLGAEIEALLLRQASEPVLAERINDYIEAVRAHFYDEECHLQAHHPKLLSAHLQEHKSYQRQLFKSCTNPVGRLGQFDCGLLTAWWLKHIQEVDAHYLEDSESR